MTTAESARSALLSHLAKSAKRFCALKDVKDFVCKWYPSLEVEVPTALLVHVTRCSIFSKSRPKCYTESSTEMTAVPEGCSWWELIQSLWRYLGLTGSWLHACLCPVKVNMVQRAIPYTNSCTRTHTYSNTSFRLCIGVQRQPYLLVAKVTSEYICSFVSQVVMFHSL